MNVNRPQDSHTGASIVAIDHAAGVVLMALPGSATPRVTWRFDRSGDCYWGHYFYAGQERDARQDYGHRVGMLV